MWRGRTPPTKLSPPMGSIVRDPIEQVILRRGSCRKFAHIPIGLEQFSTMLDRTTRSIPADFLNTQGVSCTPCI